MMKRFAIIMALSAGPLSADPLGLIDYGLLFEQNQERVEQVTPERRILRLDDVTLIEDPTEMREYTGIDESGKGAVGCVVSIIATIESAMNACEAELTPEQFGRQQLYKSILYSYYAENVQPQSTAALVQERYETFMRSQIEGARPFCSNLDLITSLADRLYSQEGEGEFYGMISRPRLPVENPCL